MPRPTCSVDGCSRIVHGQGYCGAHHQRWAVHGDAKPDIPLARRYESDSCSVADCERRRHALGFCSTHYARFKKYGTTGLPPAEPPRRWVSAWGYRMVSDSAHPNANSRGAVFEHRMVMAEVVGRPLLTTESVHHRNGDRLDNRPENLELWSKSQPAGQRVADKIAWAVELLQIYRPDLLSADALDSDGAIRAGHSLV